MEIFSFIFGTKGDMSMERLLMRHHMNPRHYIYIDIQPRFRFLDTDYLLRFEKRQFTKLHALSSL